MRYGLLQHPSDALSSLSLESIQKLALVPGRWEQLLEDNAHNPGEEGRVLSPRSTIELELNDRGREEALYLVPGGRYLVTWDEMLGVLKLWDLGLPGTAIEQPVLVAKMELGYTQVQVHVSFFENALRVCWGAHNDPGK